MVQCQFAVYLRSEKYLMVRIYAKVKMKIFVSLKFRLSNLHSLGYRFYRLSVYETASSFSSRDRHAIARHVET